MSDEIFVPSIFGIILEKISSFLVDGDILILSIFIPKYSKIDFDIAVFPIPGGPSRIKIVSETKEVNIASAKSTEDKTQLISFNFDSLKSQISKNMPLIFDITKFFPFTSIMFRGQSSFLFSISLFFEIRMYNFSGKKSFRHSVLITILLT